MVKKQTSKKQLVIGELSKHRKGFGFVAWDKDEKDIYISANHMGSAMDGDIVAVEILPAETWRGTSGIRIDENFRPARMEGRIIAVRKRKITEVAGTFYVRGTREKADYVIPAGKTFQEEIVIPESASGVCHGDRVMVRITQYPDRFRRAEGEIAEIISGFNEPGGDIKLIARSFGMREEFPAKAQSEATALKAEYVHREVYQIESEDLKNRRDLRTETIFTIDGEDSKDFDDAVSIGVLPNSNYLLGVHIADVSHYVTEGSAMDAEALQRGTSVYLLDQVIPMLPKELSNELCSLQPGKDRLTLSLDIEVDRSGAVVSHEIYESVICSKARLVYDDVSDLLEGQPEPDQERFAIHKGLLVGDYEEIEKALFLMRDLAEILRCKKEERGSIDFDIEETAITLDETGAPVSVGVQDRRVANRLIEEFMLLANETIAEHFKWLEAPFIYRVHEKPEPDKMERLRVFLQSFGIPFRSSTDKVHPKTISNILKSVQGAPFENVINTVTLRSMQKAYYSTSCDGHFGLALDDYCHFTSPIRRYPDLMIHRIIKSVINEGPTGKSFRHFEALVQEAADHSSAAERRAIEAEREVEKLKKAEYMAGKVGQIFDGIVSGVTGFGMFVQLDNTIEGLVPIEELFDDYYEYIPEMYMLQGTQTGRRYQLGDRVVIMVESVDLPRREINFCLT
ncbi:MAG: ribonuclease R [Firmicutes bacterium]|nr:ribonuclease R [Bacillota bacterium]